jgi:hypothetical protein
VKVTGTKECENLGLGEMTKQGDYYFVEATFKISRKTNVLLIMQEKFEEYFEHFKNFAETRRLRNLGRLTEEQELKLIE